MQVKCKKNLTFLQKTFGISRDLRNEPGGFWGVGSGWDRGEVGAIGGEVGVNRGALGG